MFDTMGTIVGCCSGSRVLSDENNKPYNYGKIMMADAIATCTGAMLGTSTVSTFVESSAGVSAATASALIYVGVLMMKNNIKAVDFSTAINASSAFLTIVVMVLSYSITKGIGIGMISYTIMSIISYVIEIIKYSILKKKAKEGETIEKPKWEVSVIAIIVALLFIVYFFVPTK